MIGSPTWLLALHLLMYPSVWTDRCVHLSENNVATVRQDEIFMWSENSRSVCGVLISIAEAYISEALENRKLLFDRRDVQESSQAKLTV